MPTAGHRRSADDDEFMFLGVGRFGPARSWFNRAVPGHGISPYRQARGKTIRTEHEMAHFCTSEPVSSVAMAMVPRPPIAGMRGRGSRAAFVVPMVGRIMVIAAVVVIAVPIVIIGVLAAFRVGRMVFVVLVGMFILVPYRLVRGPRTRAVRSRTRASRIGPSDCGHERAEQNCTEKSMPDLHRLITTARLSRRLIRACPRAPSGAEAPRSAA
jgi:hypothetical protein